MNRQLKKYYSIFLLSVKDAVYYRAELVIWGFIDAMPLIATLVLWLSAYGERSTIAGYTKTSLVAYYVFGYFFQDLSGAYYEDDVIEEIRSGTISGKLVKPFSLKVGLIIREIGWRLMTLVTSATPVLLISYIFAKEIYSQIDYRYIIFIPFFILVAYLMENIYSLMITAMGFVFEEATSLTHLKWMLGWLFSGSMMPFEFMPRWLAKLALLLPFQFRYYIPFQIIEGNFKVTEIAGRFFLALIWLTILILLLNRLWKRNLKQFSAVGN